METLVDLSGMRILVTGASSGIGRACAQLLTRLGATVVLTARRAEALVETRRTLADADRHAVVPADLSDLAAIPALVGKAGPLAGLVHAAGVCPTCALAATDVSDAEATYRINCLAFQTLMKAILRSRDRAPRFSAVAISSVSASAGWAGGSTYCGSKGALSALVRALAVELAPRGVRVNAVSPAHIRTPLYEAQAADADSESSLAAATPLGIGEARDVAAAVAFLLSSASCFVTGVDLPVDGGYLAR